VDWRYGTCEDGVNGKIDVVAPISAPMLHLKER